MESNFQTVTELYQRVIPALRTKKRELLRKGLSNIKEEDIWNYLKYKKWRKSQDLSLADMVNDILNTPPQEIEGYIKYNLETVPSYQQLNDVEII